MTGDSPTDGQATLGDVAGDESAARRDEDGATTAGAAPDETTVADALDALAAAYESRTDVEERVALLNRIRRRVHDLSPFDEPVDCIQWARREDVEGNDYNPNEVAPPEMDLLKHSIDEDGFTQPVVTYEVGPDDFEVVDGFHRTRVATEDEEIADRLRGYVPVTIIDKPRDERMGSTIRHNRARGTHQIQDMSALVIDLVDAGWSDERICEELGMDVDEVLRLKQVSGLKEAFGDHDFSRSWTEYQEQHGTEEGDDGDD